MMFEVWGKGRRAWSVEHGAQGTERMARIGCDNAKRKNGLYLYLTSIP